MKTIKESLKAQAAQIRTLKDAINSGMREGKYVWKEQSAILSAQRKFRYEHVAYCLLRGRTYEQIENYTKPENAIDMDSVKKIMETMLAGLRERHPEKEIENATI